MLTEVSSAKSIRLQLIFKLCKAIYKKYGFIRNSSTSHALYDHYNFIESNLERNNKVASLFLDLKKAFDLVDHKILLNKLKYNGFRGTSNRLIESYLKDRML